MSFFRFNTLPFFLTGVLLASALALLSAEASPQTHALLALSDLGDDGANPIWYRFVKYIGKLHVIVIHFPIALLICASVMQWWFVAKGRGEETAKILLGFGAIGAFFAAGLGWAFAYDSVYFGESENLLFWHRWLGTITVAVALLVFFFRNRLGKIGLAIALTLAGVLVGIVGHYGGSLVWGSDHLLKF